jgi:hypothetical protein
LSSSFLVPIARVLIKKIKRKQVMRLTLAAFPVLAE